MHMEIDRVRRKKAFTFGSAHMFSEEEKKFHILHNFSDNNNFNDRLIITTTSLINLSNDKKQNAFKIISIFFCARVTFLSKELLLLASYYVKQVLKFEY